MPPAPVLPLGVPLVCPAVPLAARLVPVRRPTLLVPPPLSLVGGGLVVAGPPLVGGGLAAPCPPLVGAALGLAELPIAEEAVAPNNGSSSPHTNSMNSVQPSRPLPWLSKNLKALRSCLSGARTARRPADRLNSSNVTEATEGPPKASRNTVRFARTSRRDFLEACSLTLMSARNCCAPPALDDPTPPMCP